MRAGKEGDATMVGRFSKAIVAGLMLVGLVSTAAFAQKPPPLCPLPAADVTTICNALGLDYFIPGAITGPQEFSLCVCAGRLAQQCGGKNDPCTGGVAAFVGGYETNQTVTGTASCMWYTTTVAGKLTKTCLKTANDPSCVCK
jgi:hypothetical protein